MSNNTTNTLATLEKFRAEVNAEMAKRQNITFTIGDIDITDNGIFYNGDPLTEDAVKKILSKFQVKAGFLEMGEKMTHADWELVKDKLKATSINQVIYGRQIQEGSDKGTIDEIYMAAPKTTGILEIDEIFGEVIDSIVSTGKDLSVKETLFLPDKDEILVTLIDNDNEIDIFGTGTDIWKAGKQIVWNRMMFQIQPFFERLSCSNGNTTKQFGFKSNVSNNKFNMNKIAKILEREITLESDNHEDMLIESVQHLSRNNISVAEFLKYRNMFDEEEHATILKKWFDDTPINRAYGAMISDQSKLWQTSADSGINAYDFFNDVTYVCSHPDDPDIENLSERQRLDIQISISDLLFKKDLDLQNIAPRIDWEAERQKQAKYNSNRTTV